jgi:HK97 family phage major capsid protein/HK97 family phage prohead protease
MTETLKTGFLTRNFAINVRSIDEEKRTVELSFSSEDPVDRWFGKEILGHGKGEVDLSFLGSGRAPLLVGHWSSDLVGVVESATIGTDRKGRAVVRFGKSNFAEEIFADVKDGVRTNVSVGYNILKLRLEEEDDDEGRTYRATLWKPLEVSLVAVPADESVGVGREKSARNYPDVETIIERRSTDPDPDPAAATKGEPMPETIETTTETRQPAAPAVDVEKIQAETRSAEKARVSEIIALGETHGFRTEAMTAIGEGTTVDDFRAFVLEKLNERGYQPVNRGADVGLTDNETRQFSFLRALNALANPSDRAAQEAAAFEFECSKAVADQMKRTAQGILVPLEVLKRDMVVGTDASGGYLVATDLLAANFIELLANRMLTRTLGAITLPGLVGDVAIPKQTGGATAYWVAESGAPTESTPVLAQLALTPKTCGAFTDISRKLLKQSSIGVEAFVRGDLARTLALALDAAGIAGSGASNQPTGILSTTGIGDVAGGTNGLAPAWSHVVDLETEVSVDNADVGALAYLSNAKVRGALKQTEKASGTGLFVWENSPEAGFGMLNGYRAGVSNQVPSNLDKGTSTGVCSAIVFGNWADLIYGLWGTIDLTVDPYTNSTSGTVRVVALQDADVGVRHPESFAAMQDALTA